MVHNYRMGLDMIEARYQVLCVKYTYYINIREWKKWFEFEYI